MTTNLTSNRPKNIDSLYFLKTIDKWPSTHAKDWVERAKQLFEDIKVIGDEDAAEEQFIAMLTQMARACLIRSGIYPASRPELPDQLKSVGKYRLASQLEEVLQKRRELKV